MENTEPTAQETGGATETVQPESINSTPAEQPRFDTADAVAAIRAHREGKTTEQPKPEPVVAEQPKVETTPEVKNEPASFNAENYLTETTKGAYKSTEELTAALEKLNNPVSLLSEHEQQILQVFKTHQNPQEYFAFQQKDFNAMDSQQILREKFAADNSDLDSDLLEEAFQRDLLNKFPHLDTDEESTDYKLAKRDLDKEANTLRADLIKQQAESKITLPEPASNEPTEEDIKKAEQFIEAAKSKVAAFNEYKVDVDGSEITVGIENKDILEKALTNPMAYLSSYFDNPDGSWNLDKVLAFVNFAENGQKVNTAIYEAGKESGTKQLIDERLKNPTPLQPSQSIPGSSQDRQDTLAQIRQHNQQSTSNI